MSGAIASRVAPEVDDSDGVFLLTFIPELRLHLIGHDSEMVSTVVG